MELIVKVGDREVLVEQDVLLDTDYGTSCYGFKFDENSPMWEKSRDVNKYYLKLQENYLNAKLENRGYLFLNEVYEALGVARTRLGQVCGWIFDPENPNGDNCVDLDISNERNNNDENVFILDPNVDGFILDKI